MTAPPKTSMPALRPYQSEALEAIREGWKEARSILVSAPTGSGKTAIFSHVAAGVGGRVLILAHREELLAQARSALKKFCGIDSSLEKAQSVASLKSRVVVASVQSMRRRLSRWPRDHFAAVIVDEAHHSAAKTYKAILAHFRSAYVLGLTATPFRGDEKDLGNLFEKEAYRVGLPDLIRQGHLSRLRVDTLPVKVDLSGVAIRKGEFDEEDAADAIEPYLEDIARCLAEGYADRRILAFLPLRKTSEAFVQACMAAGLKAEHVDGESADRAAKLERFASGAIQLLSNAMLLTEGFDCPPVDAVLLLRPTRSRVLYHQMVGRGTRIWPGKADCLILDPCFLHARVKPLTASALVAKTKEEESDLAEAIAMLEEAAGEGEEKRRGPVDLLEAARKSEEIRRKRERSLLLSLADRKTRLVADYLELALSDSVTYEPVLPWEKAAPTEGQRACLAKAGIDAALISSRGLASKLIEGLVKRREKGLATIKQVSLMRRLGYREDLNAVSFAEASAWITKRLEPLKGQ